MRKLMAILALVGAMSLVGVGTSAAPSGAGGFTCTFEVTPATLPPAGGILSVVGNAPGTGLVQIYYDPVGAPTPFLVVGNVPTDAVTGAFSANFFVTVSGEVLVAVDDYGELPCIGVAGTDVTRPGGNTTGRLPTTGASHVTTYLLIGLAALSMGLVLVAGARRRNAIRGRA